MKFLITGITGFVGPHLANLLYREEHEVYALIRCSNGRENDIRDIVPDHIYTNINFLYGNLNNYRVLQNIFTEHSFDGVFHLAAQSHPPSSFIDPIGTFEDNILNSANLIQIISEKNPLCRMMFCSTSEVYGNIGMGGQLLTNKDKLFPANPYGVSKAAIDLYMQERIENKKIQGFITRAFSHTGPRRGRNFSISSDAFQIARMMKNLQEPILKIGNLESVRVVMDVRDTARAYYLTMMHPDSNGQIFNVCGSIPRKMQFFTDKLLELSGLSNITQEICPKLYRPIDIHYQHGDSTNLKELTGWQETYSIEETLQSLLNYWIDKIK